MSFELVEGAHGICPDCGSPLVGATLTAHGKTSRYCPECHRWTPQPWSDSLPLRDWRDDMRERFEIARGTKKVP